MKVKFMPGIESISGTQRSKSGKRIMFARRSSDPKGFGRMYLRRDEDYQRKSAPSEKEVAARAKFAKANDMIKQMSQETRDKYAQEWMRSRYKFNGKKYATLRGYIMARLYAEESGLI